MEKILGVVFDSGGVISMPQDPAFFPVARQLTGLTDEAFREGWLRHRPGLDDGSYPLAEMYHRILADNGCDTLSASDLKALCKADFDSWAHPNLATFELAKDLKRLGLRLGILTNMPEEFIPWFDRMAGAFRKLADAEVISGCVRLIKPDPAIFDLMAERMALKPVNLLFLDDMDYNVKAAQACGWHAARFTSAEDARALLRDALKIQL